MPGSGLLSGSGNSCLRQNPPATSLGLPLPIPDRRQPGSSPKGCLPPGPGPEPGHLLAAPRALRVDLGPVYRARAGSWQSQEVSCAGFNLEQCDHALTSASRKPRVSVGTAASSRAQGRALTAVRCAMCLRASLVCPSEDEAAEGLERPTAARRDTEWDRKEAGPSFVECVSSGCSACTALACLVPPAH